MTKQTKLKPCPFCGGNAEIIDDAMGTISRCRCCGAENGNGVYGAEGHKLAVKDWNIRPIEESLEEENARLREALEAILDATQKENVSIPVLRFVAYTALKGEGNGA